MTSRADVRAELLAGLPAVVEEVIGAIRQEIPAYATLTADQLAEVSAIASWGIHRVLDLWVDDAALGSADITRFRGIGAARALDGRPLPGILRAYRLAGRTITELVTEAAGTGLTAADAMALATLWMSATDSISEALHAGHSQAVDRLTGDRGSALTDLLSDLVSGRQVTLTALVDRSRQLGIALPARPSVLVLRSGPDRPGTGAVSRELLDDVLSRADVARDADVLHGVVGPRGVVVGRTADTAAVVAVLSSYGARGCVVEATRAGDVRRAHDLAVLALDRAPAHAHASRPSLDEGDAQVLALLAGHSGADPTRLVHHVLGRVTDPADPRLLAGLAAYVAHGSATDAAQSLALHPQTMRYRLRRVHQLTGRDPRRTWDRFVLESALRALPAAETAPE